MKKKITAALLCAIMTLSLVGCGENEGDPESSNGESSGNGESSYSESANSTEESKPDDSNSGDSKPTSSTPTESKPEEQPKPVTNTVDWSKVPIVDEKDLVYTVYEAGDIGYGKIKEEAKERVEKEIKEVFKDGAVVITKYLGKAEYINLPDQIEGKNHILVDNNVDWGDNAKAIRFSDSFSSVSISRLSVSGNFFTWGLGKAANVTELAIPDSREYIWGFSGMPKLEYFNMPSKARHIWRGAFKGCTALKSVTIPETIESILADAFADCTALETVNFPQKLAGDCKIEDHIFQGCTSLKSIEIPEGVMQLGISSNGKNEGNVFAGCTSLAKVSLPSTIKEIYKGTFSGCTSLRSIDIPDSVTKIESGAFEGCTDISINYKGKTYTEKDIENLYDKDLSTM